MPGRGRQLLHILTASKSTQGWLPSFPALAGGFEQSEAWLFSKVLENLHRSSWLSEEDGSGFQLVQHISAHCLVKGVPWLSRISKGTPWSGWQEPTFLYGGCRQTGLGRGSEGGASRGWRWLAAFQAQLPGSQARVHLP